MIKATRGSLGISSSTVAARTSSTPTTGSSSSRISSTAITTGHPPTSFSPPVLSVWSPVTGLRTSTC
eukprot:798451-Rhodomonas_salina.1